MIPKIIIGKYLFTKKNFCIIIFCHVQYSVFLKEGKDNSSHLIIVNVMELLNIEFHV